MHLPSSAAAAVVALTGNRFESPTPFDVTPFPHAQGLPCYVLKSHCTRTHNNNNNNKQPTKTTYLRGAAVIMSVVVRSQRRQQPQRKRLRAPGGVAHCLPFILVTRASYTYMYTPWTTGRARVHTHSGRSAVPQRRCRVGRGGEMRARARSSRADRSGHALRPPSTAMTLNRARLWETAMSE